MQALPVDGQATHSAGLSPISAEPSPLGPASFNFPPPADRTSPLHATSSSVPFPSTSTSTPRPGHDRSKPGSDVYPLLGAAGRSLIPAPLSITTTEHCNAPDGSAYPIDLQDDYEPDGRKFQYGATVNELTLQFLSDNEETRVAALEWLLMLHQKAPRKVRQPCHNSDGAAWTEGFLGSQILAGDDPSLLARKDRASANAGRQRNPSTSSTSSGLSLAVLLKLLSDSSERVLRSDLQLLAQISSLGDGTGGSSGEDYFAGLMTSLLELFSTDRKLLETRGSLIIRQLCGSLDAERIYRTCAEILEADEVRVRLPRQYGSMPDLLSWCCRISTLRASWCRILTSS